MLKIMTELLMDGYDILFNNYRTISGFLHPKAQDHVEIILQKRLPGLRRKGGAAYAKASVPWKDLSDPKIMEDVFLKSLKPKVDQILFIEKAKKQ